MLNSLFRCTFTGVDEFTSLEKLKELSHKYSFVEWGVLISTSENKRFNGYRYPSREWLEENIIKLAEISYFTGAGLALHICGGETKKLLEQQNDSLAIKLIEKLSVSNRVQINFCYKNNQVKQLEDLCLRFNKIQFITQHNNCNKDLFEKISAPNHQILFDESGGKGLISKKWNDRLPNKICGYAGGLGEDNIEYQVEKIKSLSNKAFWIDMESKIRTNDKLDLEVCENILKKLMLIN